MFFTHALSFLACIVCLDCLVLFVLSCLLSLLSLLSHALSFLACIVCLACFVLCCFCYALPNMCQYRSVIEFSQLSCLVLFAYLLLLVLSYVAAWLCVVSNKNCLTSYGLSGTAGTTGTSFLQPCLTTKWGCCLEIVFMQTNGQTGWLVGTPAKKWWVVKKGHLTYGWALSSHCKIFKKSTNEYDETTIT